MKKALREEMETIRLKFHALREKGEKAGDAMDQLAEEFECSTERIRQIVYLKKKPYGTHYQHKKRKV